MHHKGGSCGRSFRNIGKRPWNQERRYLPSDKVSVEYGQILIIIIPLIRYTPIDGQDRSQPLPYDPRSDITRQVHDSCSKSLKNLRTTYLDSYLLHSPLSTMERTLEAWQALCELQDSGVVKSIGMSNVYDG
jgi:hypothetical protein